LAEEKSSVTLDPQELTLMHQKRITFVGSLLCPLSLLKSRLYDGVIKGILESIITNKETFKISESPTFKSITVDADCTIDKITIEDSFTVVKFN
jgi:hypothetical protein